ncbi:MAG: sugar porter family MFS transporter, partial [Candidatus Marinimicrobia bacterium]|nr:sugar porter family MFS transporter [Candidatus Neomarinimicrobiota bacterium]
MRGYVIGSTVVAALGGFLFGFDTAVISGTVSSLETVFSLSDFWLGFTVAVALIGTIIGSLSVGKPGDAYGRKNVLIVLAVFYTISAIGSALSANWYLFLSFRFIGGLAVGGASVMSPMYIAEIAPAAYRGRLVAVQQFNVVFGILIAFLSNYFLATIIQDNAWRYMLGVEAIPAFLFFALLFLIPNSPRWLVKKDRVDEARDILSKTGEPDPEKALNDIIKSIEVLSDQASEKFFSKKYSLPILTAMLIAFFNQMSGINAIMYYAPRIFEMTGLAMDAALLQSVAIGVTNMVFTIIAMSIIDKVGRKTLLLVGSVGMVFFLGMVAREFYLQDFGGYDVMLYLVGYIAFFAMSQGAVIWVFISEIFPNKVRSQGQALGSFTHWTMAAVVSWSFPIMASG